MCFKKLCVAVPKCPNALKRGDDCTSQSLCEFYVTLPRRNGPSCKFYALSMVLKYSPAVGKQAHKMDHEKCPHRDWTAGLLATPLPAFPESATCADAFEWFNANPQQVASAILDKDYRVIGIVNRLRFLSRYAKRYFPELYGNKSILLLANTTPLVVDEKVPLSEVASALTLEFSDALRECFVVTQDGKYFGIGTAEAVVRSKVEMLLLREKQLKTALLSADDANKTKSNFLALMSHELRTPLNAIIGFSDVLASELYGPIGKERYREYAHDIHDAGKHLLALINDILDLSKAEAGKLEFHPEQIAIPEFFTNCLSLVTAHATRKQLRLTTHVAEDVPSLWADPLRMKQILVNLLSNAVKFTPVQGSVELCAVPRSDGGITLYVRDTGIGMSAESIPMALEPFRQIASPHARNAEGTGLGLTLVKRLTELHDGTLSIESTENKGTTVYIHLPATCVVAGRLRQIA